ncbi:MAG TPA: hypothetical protein DCM45_07660 [Clostridiales bacterium]|nr:hypothetical protein [Clostridiales bacterium]
MMYEKYILCKDSLQNISQNGETTGFSLQIRIPYYRGVPLSMVEDLKVVIDSTEYRGDALRFTVGGGTFSLAEMPTVTFFRWEFGEKATLQVSKAGGLPAGDHKVEVYVLLRISYMPWRGYTKAWADMQLA